MEHLNRTIALFVMLMGLCSCGVKGRPLPPLNPAPLGRGEPTYKESQKKPLKKVFQREAEEDTSDLEEQ